MRLDRLRHLLGRIKIVDEDLMRSEPKFNFTLGVFRIGGCVDDIFINALGGDASVGSSDRAGSGFLGVGGAADLSDFSDRVCTEIHQSHRALGVILTHEIPDDIFEKRLFFHMDIMLLSQLAIGGLHLAGHNSELRI